MSDDDADITPRPVSVTDVLWRELRAHQLRLVELEADRGMLFGHRGQNGALNGMNARIDAQVRDVAGLEDRVAQLERWRWQMVGAATLLGALVSALVSKL